MSCPERASERSRAQAAERGGATEGVVARKKGGKKTSRPFVQSILIYKKEHSNNLPVTLFY